MAELVVAAAAPNGGSRAWIGNYRWAAAETPVRVAGVADQAEPGATNGLALARQAATVYMACGSGCPAAPHGGTQPTSEAAFLAVPQWHAGP